MFHYNSQTPQPMTLVLGIKPKFCGLGQALGRPWPCKRGLIKRLSLGQKFKTGSLADWLAVELKHHLQPSTSME